MATPELTTTYAIEVQSSDGCIAEDTIIVHVKEHFTIILPNVISSTGENSTFMIPNIPQIEKVSQYVIFDRWGNVMHRADNFDVSETQYFWNERTNGNLVAHGVYVYMVDLLLLNGETYQLAGDVTVIRWAVWSYNRLYLRGN